MDSRRAPRRKAHPYHQKGKKSAQRKHYFPVASLSVGGKEQLEEGELSNVDIIQSAFSRIKSFSLPLPVPIVIGEFIISDFKFGQNKELHCEHQASSEVLNLSCVDAHYKISKNCMDKDNVLQLLVELKMLSQLLSRTSSAATIGTILTPPRIAETPNSKRRVWTYSEAVSCAKEYPTFKKKFSLCLNKWKRKVAVGKVNLNIEWQQDKNRCFLIDDKNNCSAVFVRDGSQWAMDTCTLDVDTTFQLFNKVLHS